MNNLSKAQLIELATSQDIRFKKNWNKQKIIEAINSGIKNSDHIGYSVDISNQSAKRLIEIAELLNLIL